MDKLLYIAASGAKQDLLGTTIRANNLANAQTIGFKAQLEQTRAMPAFGDGLPTRVFSMTESPTNNYEGGPMVRTDRELDVAIQGDGWFAVQDKQGNEAYTRRGGFQLSEDGMLEDGLGNPVLGGAGPIFLPQPVSNVNIATDGTISIRPLGAPETVLAEVGQLKMVNPDPANMTRGLDGLYRMEDGSLANEDVNVRLQTGMLEGSNVNAVDEMVNMIHLQRHYEMQIKLMKKADTLVMRSNMLLRIL
ncbi:flagellar basal-body rod protein FlgF [Aestuariibacter salexigens]|uniref:flagellar basal-body rod protein FlgF n=1 Tax=Aestuariibacter salexigens TaxID=226010 RepID=UPI0004000669|nr:flagellar basal-body rod protein FlgF [Aestuariibacter salexigens]